MHRLVLRGSDLTLNELYTEDINKIASAVGIKIGYITKYQDYKIAGSTIYGCYVPKIKTLNIKSRIGYLDIYSPNSPNGNFVLIPQAMGNAVYYLTLHEIGHALSFNIGNYYENVFWHEVKAWELGVILANFPPKKSSVEMIKESLQSYSYHSKIKSEVEAMYKMLLDIISHRWQQNSKHFSNLNYILDTQ